MAVGVISGTGLYDFELMKGAQKRVIETPYGEAIVYLTEYLGQEVIFLPRHGKEHGILPHLINYQANIYALASLGCQKVISFCCVGSMALAMSPGSLVLVEQFIDQTWGREITFAENGAVDHVEMTEPYCSSLGERLLAAAAQNEIPVVREGVYLCTQGPRFETAAEIKAYTLWGANLVGMTGVPEAQLAKEAGLCYASLAVVANYAAGFASDEAIDAEGISQIMSEQKDNLEQILQTVLSQKEQDRDCACGDAKIAVCQRWGY